MRSGIYYDDYCSSTEYVVVKPIGNHMQLIVGGWKLSDSNKIYITLGVFPCQCTYKSMTASKVWGTPTSTNNDLRTALKVRSLAIEALREVEEIAIEENRDEKIYFFVDGLDHRRLEAYAKILKKYDCGYRESPFESDYVPNAHMLMKIYKPQ